ncbi:hypothetical protein SAMN04488074_12213 [Lentzea albidocapillata subsp. violacea]|uniref:Uncharacterized protein n=1 Tax=Lentzea albidocapillata subsp. violacea TaxID=128104 RepID=A0A1G9TGN0_9PSEU|nr:DUF6480 family protein [Lentzea albidocapillata]SDM46877.1 hypothetical protein SAMN04488074_12213 [Lentzea albidocapillata subsp. violacea]
MTATPPDPDPQRTPGLEPGGGVRPGDTPPESGQTSGLSHHEPAPPKATTTRIVIALILLLAVLVAAMLLTQAFLLV